MSLKLGGCCRVLLVVSHLAAHTGALLQRNCDYARIRAGLFSSRTPGPSPPPPHPLEQLRRCALHPIHDFECDACDALSNLLHFFEVSVGCSLLLGKRMWMQSCSFFNHNYN